MLNYTKAQFAAGSFKLFKHLMRKFPKGQIVPGKNPDFMVSTKRKSKGIEFAALFQAGKNDSTSRKAQATRRQDIIDQANRLYHKSSLPPVRVDVTFNERYVIQRSKVPALSKRIAGYVRQHLPEAKQSFQDAYPWEKGQSFPMEVWQVMLHRTPNMVESYFTCSNGDYLPRLSNQLIQSYIDKKGMRYKSLSRKCNEVWLVMVVNYGMQNAKLEDIEQQGKASFVTPFDRAFLLSIEPEVLLELNLEKPV